MGAIGKIAKFALSPLLAVAGVFDKPKPPKAPLQAPPQASRGSVVNDALAERTGTRANRRSRGSQEARGGKKTSLGS